MNNNDILNELNSSADSFAPSDRLAPDSIEKSLSGVKRRSYKGVTTACTSLAVVCLTVVGVRTALLQNSGPQAPVVEEKSQTNSYHDIYKAVKKVKKKKEGSIFDRFIEAYMYEYSVDSISVSADALGAIQDNSLAKAESFETNSATTGVAGQAAEHSETNNQVSGVDEADVVKTDGKYIYSVNDDQIFITAPNNGMPARVSTINLSLIHI